MRCAAGAGLLVLVGCNQIFGIHKTEPYDASADVIPDRPFVKLTWQVATLLPPGDRPDPMIDDVPIDPPPRIRYGRIEQPLVDAAYLAEDGSITIERELFEPGVRWRLEYTLANDTPHEVQWSPQDKRGHLTVPLVGRTVRSPVPAGSGYTVSPIGVSSYTDPRLFTTGLWTEGRVTSHTGAMVDYDFFNAASMSGAKARPESAAGDQAVLVDYATDAARCRVARGSAALASADLTANQHTPTIATWDAETRPIASEPVGVAFIERLARALGKLDPGVLLGGTHSFGIAPSAGLPGLIGVPASGQLLVTTALPTPVMVTLAECPYNMPLPDAAQPKLFDGFPRMVHAQLVSTRRVLGVSLNSGMETAITSTSAGFTIDFPAAVPTLITLTTPVNGAIDLAGDSEQLDVGAASGPFTLAFAPEAGLSADYYEVTLYRLEAGGLTPERIYTVTAPAVSIEPSALRPGVEYVFQIRSFRGQPDASLGDFRTVTYPYGSAIVFTRTFHTS